MVVEVVEVVEDQLQTIIPVVQAVVEETDRFYSRPIFHLDKKPEPMQLTQ